MANFLITGATGFIGTNLFAYLKKREHNVYVLGRPWVDLTDNNEFTKKYIKTNFARLLDKMNVIIHLADVHGNMEYYRNNKSVQFVANSRMTLNMMEIWKEYFPSAKFVGISSAWAYPDHMENLYESNYEDGPPFVATYYYGLSKRFLKDMIDSHRDQHGMSGVTVVLPNVYGPGDNLSGDKRHVIPSLLYQARMYDTIIVKGSGEGKRDFVYIDDIVGGLEAISLYDKEIDLINFGSGVGTSINTIAQIISSMYNNKPIKHDYYGINDESTRLLPSMYFWRNSVWQPTVDITTGLQLTNDAFFIED